MAVQGHVLVQALEHPRRVRAPRLPVLRFAAVPLLQLAAVPLLAVLGLVVWLGRYTRPMADDFCMAGLVRRYGLAGAQPHWYQAWSGRYTGTLATTLAAQAGERAMYPLLLALVLSWCIAASALLRSVGGGLLTICAMLCAAPALIEILYWQDGMMYYLLPVVLQTILLAVVAGAAPTPRRVALVGALAFAAAGCHESAIVLQCGLCALVPVIYPAWRPRRPYLIAIALASVGGGIIDIAAPGNAVRAAYFPAHPPIVWAAMQAAGQFWPLLLHLLPLLVAVMGGAALLLPGADQRSLRRALAIIPLAGLVAIATIMPAWYAEHGAAPDRNLFFPAAILVAVAIWLGRHCRAPRLARVPALRIACAGIVALACLTNAAPGLRTWNTEAPAYAAWWSTLDAALRQPADSVARSIGPGGDLGGVVPGSWQAECVASAYGRAAIRGLWPAR